MFRPNCAMLVLRNCPISLLPSGKVFSLLQQVARTLQIYTKYPFQMYSRSILHIPTSLQKGTAIPRVCHIMNMFHGLNRLVPLDSFLFLSAPLFTNSEVWLLLWHLPRPHLQAVPLKLLVPNAKQDVPYYNNCKLNHVFQFSRVHNTFPPQTLNEHWINWIHGKREIPSVFNLTTIKKVLSRENSW